MRRTILRSERLKRNLTIDQVAKEVGIKRAHYNNIELGVSNPRWDVGCKIGKYFDMDGCYLLQKDGDEPNDI